MRFDGHTVLYVEGRDEEAEAGGPLPVINVGDVLRALEGSTAVMECVGTSRVSCDNACSCSARPLWLKLQRRIDEVLDTTTLADMAEDYKQQRLHIQTLENHTEVRG